MRLVLINGERPGLLKGDSVVDVSEVVRSVAGRNGQETMTGIIANFAALRADLARALDRGQGVPASGVTVSAPLPRPGKIMMMGANFKEGVAGPPLPIWGFFKSPEAVLSPGGTVVLPPEQFTICHHEAEMVVVIGKEGHRISYEDAMSYVFGYTNGVDVSARFPPDLANSLLGKSYNTFAPMGPAIVTADEAPDPYALQMRLWVDGELRQDYPISDIGHDIAASIVYFSARTTLKPGDVLFLGTNHQGLGPLQDGDNVEVEVTGFGRLRFNVSDPSKRTWPKGIDPAVGAGIKQRRLEFVAQAARGSE